MTNKDFQKHFTAYWVWLAGAKNHELSDLIEKIKGYTKHIDKNSLTIKSCDKTIDKLAGTLYHLLRHLTGMTYLECKNASKDILLNRSHDYSNEQDRLLNFKNVAKDMPISAASFGWCLARKHIDAVITSLDNNIERSQDWWVEKLIDPINYCILISALFKKVKKKFALYQRI